MRKEIPLLPKMTEHMMARFKEWLAHTLAPFYIKREKTPTPAYVASIFGNDDDVEDFSVVDFDAASFGETKRRHVNMAEVRFYCCLNGKIDRQCKCGRPPASMRGYVGQISTQECDANGVESERLFWRPYCLSGQLPETIEAQWQPNFRMETAAEAYTRFLKTAIDGTTLAQWCERRQLATSLKPLTAEICLANHETYEHLAVLMALSPTSSYSPAEMLQFRKSARVLKRTIDMHYALEGAGGQQAAANFFEVAEQSAYFEAKLASAAENTQLASELVHAARAIAKNTNAVGESVFDLAQNSDKFAEEMEKNKHVFNDVATALQGLVQSVDGVASHLSDIDSQIGDFSDKFVEQPRKKARIAQQ